MQNEKEISRKLDVVIGLLAELIESQQLDSKQKAPESQKFARLKQYGLENIEIAKIFGRSNDQVAKLIYEVKRKKK